MAKVCIILNTIYDDSLPAFYNSEVQHDAHIVRETLRDHAILEIDIPLMLSQLKVHKLIDKSLGLMELDEDSECHIVLNTHGAPGSSDIKHECVVYLVEKLSYLQASVSQISALQCDGMKPDHGQLSFATFYSMSIPHAQKNKHRPACLSVLQKKLNSLTLDKAQAFSIRGFMDAYNPFESESDVVSLLNGEGGLTLGVNISALTFSADYFYLILDKLDCLADPKALSRENYQELANFFSDLLDYMKKHLEFMLSKKQEITVDSAFFPLWQALSLYAIQQGIAIHHDRLTTLYKSWLKEYKLYSPERRNVFSGFAEISLANLSNDSAPSVLGH